MTLPWETPGALPPLDEEGQLPFHLGGPPPPTWFAPELTAAPPLGAPEAVPPLSGDPSGQPVRADAAPAFQGMPDESQLVGPALGGVAIPEGTEQSEAMLPPTVSAPAAPLAPASPPPPDGPGPDEMRAPPPASAPINRDLLTPEGLEGDVERAQLARIEGMSPEDYAAERAGFEHDRAMATATRRGEEIEADARRAEQNRLDWQTATAKARNEWASLQREASDLATKGIDENQWFDNLEDGQRFAGYLGAAINGWLNPGGRNATVDLAMKLADRNIDSQRENLAHQRGMLQQRQGVVAELYAMSGDEYRAAETARLAAYATIDERLATEQAKFDPRGSRFYAIADERQAVRARMTEHAAKVEGELHKRAMDEAEFNRKVAEDKARAENDRRQVGLGYSRIAADERQTKAGRDAGMMEKGFVADSAAPGGYRYDPTLAEQIRGPQTAKLAAETDKAISDAEKARRENDPTERARQLGVGGVKRKDGAPVLFRSAEEAAKVAKSKAATDTAALLIDNLKIMRDEHGFSSDMVKSKEWRQMQADYAALQLEIKNTAELGVLAGPDMDLIGRALGTEDPTEFRDVTAGLDAARKNLVNKLNSTIRANVVSTGPGEDPEPYEPPRMEKAAALERTKEENADIITQGIPPHLRADQEGRAREVERKQAAATVALRRQEPSAAELQSWARKVDEQVARGDLTKDEAISIVTPMAERVVAEEQRKIQDMSVDELKKLQEDPAFMGRARLLQLSKSGARPEELYRLVVGE